MAISHVDAGVNDGRDHPQDEAYALCDVHVKMRNEHIDREALNQNSKVIAESMMSDLLNALKMKLNAEPDLCKKKALYVRLGCRGDWPNIELPE